ncbi:MAG: protein-S-isoprenylcysteine O-methyltransferase [Pseudomonadota bacterium]
MKKLAPLIGFAFMIGIAYLMVRRVDVNGWGSFGWFATALGIMIIRQPYANQIKGNSIDDKRETGIERLLLILVAVGGSYFPVIHLAFGIVDFANYSLPVWAPIIGVIILAAGLYLFWRSHADLGKNWSVTTELRDDHTLTTGGVYTHIRHPMYSALFLIFAIQPLFIHNWLAGFSGVVGFAILYLFRVSYEETMMRDRFGAEYDDYVSKTGRILPKLG